MPKRSNDFQRLIHWIEAQLYPEGWTVTESAMLPDRRDGRLTEVDVLISGQVGGKVVMVGIECRHHKRRQGKNWINELIAKYQNLPQIARVVAVSRSGFGAPAIEITRLDGILTLSLEEALQTRWISVTQGSEIPLWIFGLPELAALHIISQENDTIRQRETPNSLLDATLVEPTTEEVRPLLAFAKHHVMSDQYRSAIEAEAKDRGPGAAGKVSTTFALKFQTPKNLVFENGHAYTITGIKLTTRMHTERSHFRLTMARYQNDAEVMYGYADTGAGRFKFRSLHRPDQEILVSVEPPAQSQDRAYPI